MRRRVRRLIFMPGMAENYRKGEQNDTGTV
nr:MAG TPA: hypothetical protein [Caudoviricetes sp.]